MTLHGTYVGDDRVLVRLVAGGRLLVSSRDLTLMPELVAEGGYDAPFTAYLQRTLRPDSVFVDVGANVGLFTVIGALTATEGTVLAYEPVPELAALLRDNVQVNWLTGRVIVREVAVADHAGRMPFSFDPTLQVLGGLAAHAPDGRSVEVVALDDELGGFDHIDLVKIDVEGGELGVLRGMRRLMAAGRIARISCEVRSDAVERTGAGDSLDALATFFEGLQRNGWTFALIAPDGSEMPRTVAEMMATEPHPNVVLRRPDHLTAP